MTASRAPCGHGRWRATAGRPYGSAREADVNRQQAWGRESQTDESRGPTAGGISVVRDGYFAAIGCREQRSCGRKATALSPAAERQDRLATVLTLAHARALHAFGDQRLARRFDYPGADRHAALHRPCVVHLFAVTTGRCALSKRCACTGSATSQAATSFSKASAGAVGGTVSVPGRRLAKPSSQVRSSMKCLRSSVRRAAVVFRTPIATTAGAPGVVLRRAASCRRTTSAVSSRCKGASWSRPQRWPAACAPSWRV